MTRGPPASLPPNAYRHCQGTSPGILGRVNIQDFYTGDNWAALVTCKNNNTFRFMYQIFDSYNSKRHSHSSFLDVPK